MSQEIKLAHISLAGRKHRERGLRCEDASLSVCKHGVSVVCLSDGAGGSQYTHAEIGAKCIVKTITDLLTRHFDAFYYDNRENLVRNIIISAVQAEIAIKGNDKGNLRMEELSATMMFCAVKDRRMICGHIGDGMIARVSGSGLSPITLPQNGENASSTYFVTIRDAQNYLRIIRTTTDDTHAVVLMTDGVTDLVYDESKMLIMPVVARLAEIAVLQEADKQIKLSKTIRNYIVNASPVSDDASFGVLYFVGTPAPSIDMLPAEKEIATRDFRDDMRAVQLEMLPRVQKARAIVYSDNDETVAAKDEIAQVSDAIDSCERNSLAHEHKPCISQTKRIKSNRASANKMKSPAEADIV